MLDLTLHPDRLERAVQRAKERDIIIPTFDEDLIFFDKWVKWHPGTF